MVWHQRRYIKGRLCSHSGTNARPSTAFLQPVNEPPATNPTEDESAVTKRKGRSLGTAIVTQITPVYLRSVFASFPLRKGLRFDHIHAQASGQLWLVYRVGVTFGPTGRLTMRCCCLVQEHR